MPRIRKKPRPLRPNHSVPCQDHLGQKFDSIKSMCAHWNVSPEAYARRRKVYKMSVKEALTTPVKHNGGLVCYDHKGTRFRSRTYMCNHWHIERKLFEYRISHGWSLEDALTKPRRTSKKNKPSEP